MLGIHVSTGKSELNSPLNNKDITEGIIKVKNLEAAVDYIVV